MLEAKVLDKGFVTLLDRMGSDLTVVNAARVSFSKQSALEAVPPEHDGATGYFRLSESDAKLIRYLAKNGHWTPFGHPQLQFHFKMPIFVARQFMRSNVGIVYNEISRRYVDTPPEFYEPKEWRARPVGGIKQGSSTSVVPWGLGTCDAVVAAYMALEAYKHLLDDGVAPEMARMVLPLSMYTEFWATMSLAACARVCTLRLHNHAQKEIQDYATAIDTLVRPVFPVSWPALLDSGGDSSQGQPVGPSEEGPA